MLHVPRVDTEIVKSQAHCQDGKRGKQDVFVFCMNLREQALHIAHCMVAEEADTQEQTDTQSKLPWEEEGTLLQSILQQEL